MLMRQMWFLDKTYGPIIVSVLGFGLIAPIAVKLIPKFDTHATDVMFMWFGYGLLLIEFIGAIYVIYKFWGKILDILRRFKQNHGAEHKCIWCHQKGLELTINNVKSMPKEHPNCGGTIVVWYIILVYIFFHTPIFAFGGIIFGVLLNRKTKGRGNMIIIASVVLGLSKFILGYFFLSMVR